MSKNKKSFHLKLFEKSFVKAKIYHMVNLKNDLMVAFNLVACHCVKYVQIGVFSGPYFPAFGLLRIQFKSGEIRTRKHRIWTIFMQCAIVLVSI